MWRDGNALQQDGHEEILPEMAWAASDALRQRARSTIPGEQSLLEEIMASVCRS